MDIAERFAYGLNELMENRDIAEVSECVGISVPVIYRYLRKTSMPSLHNAVAIAKYFGCSLDFLFGLTDKKYSLNKNEPAFRAAFQNMLKQRKCTRYKLQKDTGISSQSIDDWFNGKREPSVANAIKVAEYFGCSLDELTGRG